MKKRIRIGIGIDESLLKRCDENIQKANTRTRSEFFDNALEFYITWLNAEVNSKVMTPMLENVISAKIQDTENRIARVLFKQTVELAMLMHVVAYLADITPEQIESLRGRCVAQVKELNGKLSFSDIAKYQNG